MADRAREPMTSGYIIGCHRRELARKDQRIAELEAALTAAILAEREECARVAESTQPTWEETEHDGVVHVGTDGEPYWVPPSKSRIMHPVTGKDIAAAIRARGNIREQGTVLVMEEKLGCYSVADLDAQLQQLAQNCACGPLRKERDRLVSVVPAAKIPDIFDQPPTRLDPSHRRKSGS